MDFQGYINNCKKNKPIRLKLVITHQNPKKNTKIMKISIHSSGKI